MTKALFVSNDTIMALIKVYHRREHPKTLKLLTERSITVLPSNSTLFKPDHSDALFGAIVRNIMFHDPNHAIVSRGRHHVPISNSSDNRLDVVAHKHSV